MLPGIDDGAADLAASLEMARTAVADGITITVCTPHILPTVYNNTGPAIRFAVERLQVAISDAGIPLRLLAGADVHIASDLIQGLRSGRVLALNDTRYLLLEPPHHVMPPRLEDFIFSLMTAGYIPVLTHPERLAWIEQRYPVIKRLAHSGVLMQITGNSLLGRFGRAARHWALRMLDERLVHLVATDAHDAARRPPRLREAWELIATRFDEQEAEKMTLMRPKLILENANPSQLDIQAPRAKSFPRQSGGGSRFVAGLAGR